MRITRTSAGIVVDGSSDGRGAWLCRDAGSARAVDPSCLETALARRAFARAWHVELTDDDEHAIRIGLTGGNDETDAP